MCDVFVPGDASIYREILMGRMVFLLMEEGCFVYDFLKYNWSSEKCSNGESLFGVGWLA